MRTMHTCKWDHPHCAHEMRGHGKPVQGEDAPAHAVLLLCALCVGPSVLSAFAPVPRSHDGTSVHTA